MTAAAHAVPARGWRRHRWTVLKLGVSVGLVAAVASFYDITGLAARLRDLRPVPALSCVATLFVQVLVVAYRWRTLTRACAIEAPWLRLLRFTFVGQFFSQLLPSTVGGDAVKGWLLFRDGAAPRRVVLSVLADRVIGVISLLLLVVLILQTPRATALAEAVTLSLLAVLAAGTAGTALLLGLPALAGNRYLRWPIAAFVIELAVVLRAALGGCLRAARLLGMGLLVHVCSIVAAVCAARAVGLSLDPGVLAVVFPIAMLSATIPVSIGGWGVREGVLVGLLGTYGVPAEGALALSIVFGVALALASLPGAALWFGTPREARAGDIERAWQNSMGTSQTKD